MFISKDSFNPSLVLSEPLDVTDEQKGYIKRILDISCSDSRFADKAFIAIIGVLTKGISPTPVITSLNPATIEIGQPTFDIHVMGENFDPESVIVFNGFDEPTTFVSAGELTTGVNMDVWLTAAICPVMVRSKDGITSDPVPFEFTQSAPITRSAQEAKDRMKESLEHTVKSKDQGFHPNPPTPQNVTNETPDGVTPGVK
jgi:hypothetical protein